MDITTSNPPIVREVFIEASRETIFPFFTDSDKITRWLATTATLDARPGGAWVQTHTDGDTIHALEGTFLEVDAPARVVFTWGFHGADTPVPVGSSTVEVTLAEEGSGTRVRLVHTGLPQGDQTTNHGNGWVAMLDRLATAVESAQQGEATR
jgi:uncharacterized protein YndB with AHSA1/START domain